jgi:hypothetical protein
MIDIQLKYVIFNGSLRPTNGAVSTCGTNSSTGGGAGDSGWGAGRGLTITGSGFGAIG